MGTLKLPSSGSVYADTQIFIYTVERHPVYEPLLQPLWSAAQASVIKVASSELTLMETLIMPIRISDLALQQDYRTALGQSEVELYAISRDVLEEAARLRAAIPGLRTPDAIHAATALVLGCALFLTNDTGFRRIPALPLVLLDDVLNAP